MVMDMLVRKISEQSPINIDENNNIKEEKKDWVLTFNYMQSVYSRFLNRTSWRFRIPSENAKAKYKVNKIL